MTGTALAPALLRLATDLRQIGVPWAVVGGLAVSVRAEPRTTRDVDAVVAVAEDQAVQVASQLRHLNYRIGDNFERREDRRLATLRLAMPPSHEGLLADLLFASSGIEKEIVAEAEVLEILPGVSAPVATTGHLLALKVLATQPDRPQDGADGLEVLRVADQGDIHRARQALDLIDRRGYHREKDLQAEFEAHLQLVRGRRGRDR